jgi:DNA modification methylase
MVRVFDGVHRVLKDNGTLWLNLGDCYWGPKNFGGDEGDTDGVFGRRHKRLGAISGRSFEKHAVLKTKDLIGQPWRVALALQADGWYLRSDIIWHKPNPMPESVTDRPTRAHEYLFLLTKTDRYFYDNDAIKEPAGGWRGSKFDDGKNALVHPTVGRNRQVTDVETRNKRSVWTVATSGFPDAHFATFPPDLIEPCILAGSAKGQTVLDPFGGAGTTGLVADRLGRDALLIELNPKYAEMARRRIHSDNPLFGDVA